MPLLSAAISDNLPGGLSPFVHWVVASQSGGAGCAITVRNGSSAAAISISSKQTTAMSRGMST